MNPRTLTLLAFMLFVAASRILFSCTSEMAPFSNFTPIGAMALFGGAYFSRYKSFAFPLLTLCLSDIVLNFVLYHEWRLLYEGFYWTYGAFALMTVVGKLMQPNKSVQNFVLSTLTIVMIHWIVTDMGVWLEDNLYPPTIKGLWTCLAAAIPFEINFLAGTVIYGAILFGNFEWLKKYFKSLNVNIA